MMFRTYRLRLTALVAVLASSLLHVAAMAISPEFGQEILVEGGDGETKAVLGSDFADMVKAGDRLDPVETLETAVASPPPITQPIPRPAATQPIAAPLPTTASPTPPVHSALSPSLKRLEPAQDDGLVAPTATERAEASVPKIPASQPSPERPQPTEPVTVEVEAKAVPVTPVETVTPIERTEHAKAAAPAVMTKPVAKPEKPKVPREKLRAGSTASRSEVDNKAGSQDGKTTANAKSSGKSKSKPTSANSGNAAAANYPGKVYAKIARTRQRNAGGKGVTHVSFHVTASGQAVSVTVSRSSGNARVDKAALAHVKRAAPFPKPPVGARTRFVIPLEFRR